MTEPAAAFFTRGRRPSDIVLDEEPSYRSRRVVTVAPITGAIASFGTEFRAGRVLVRRKIEAVGTVSFVSGSPAGKGTLVLPTFGKAWKADAIPGLYSFRCVAASANAGTFELTAPNGLFLQTLTAGPSGSAETVNTPFLVGMRIVDGGVDFEVGDAFFLTLDAPSAPTWEVLQNDGHTAESQAFLDPVVLVEDAPEAGGKALAVAREARLRREYLVSFGLGAWDDWENRLAERGIVFE
jgi:hypothetical protein